MHQSSRRQKKLVKKDCRRRFSLRGYGATGFNQKNFWAREAPWATIMMGFNLMSLLHKLLLKKEHHHTLKI